MNATMPTPGRGLAALLYVEALERLAKEQDEAEKIARDYADAPGAFRHTEEAHRATIATTRVEAAKAAEALWRSLASSDSWTYGKALAEHAVLRSIDAVPSAALLSWAAGWRRLFPH